MKETFKRHGKSVKLQFLDPLEQSLVALQGPTAASVLRSIMKINLTHLSFMNSVESTVFGNPIRVTRCGYTGEDGFEISMPAKIARTLVQAVLDTPDTKLAGLGARDSLRYSIFKIISKSVSKAIFSFPSLTGFFITNICH